MAPRFAATIFMDAVQATYSQVMQALPAMVQQLNDQQSESQKYENAFYDFWDQRGFDLREHEQELAVLGNAYRGVNPTARPEDVITQVGAQLILAKQLAPKEGVQGQGTSTEPAKTPPFNSAAGAPGVLPPGPQQKAPMEAYLDELIEDANFG